VGLVASRKTAGSPSGASVDSNLVPFLDLLAELIAGRIVAEVRRGGGDSGLPPEQQLGNPGPIPTAPAQSQTQSHPNPKPAVRRTARGGTQETP